MAVAPPNRTSQGTLVVRHLTRVDFPAADNVRRLAFGTMFGLSDPMSFRGDQTPDWTRLLTYPTGSFAAEIDGELVGTNFAVNWGSVGLIGPVSVLPSHWNRGIAQELVAQALETLDHQGVDHVGLYTLADSAKHMVLYQKFGFWPRFITVIMSKPVEASLPHDEWLTLSTVSDLERQSVLGDCRKVTEAIHQGLDLSSEIRATVEHELGETVLITNKGSVEGFAVCHIGPNTEGGSDNCYVKFGAVKPGTGAERSLMRLLQCCEALAAERGVTRLSAGVNTARREAYRCLLAFGFRTAVQGLAMHRPDEPAYNRPGVYVIDDWR